MIFGNYTMKSYQEEAINIAIAEQKGMLIVLPPGSGKSLIMYWLIQNNPGPHMVCSFKYVLYEHYLNLKELTAKKIEIIKKEFPKLEKGEGENSVLLVTPEMVTKHRLLLSLIPFKWIFLDESQMFKNHSSKRTKSILMISEIRKNAKKILMSATPCPEHVGELQPQMQIIDTGILGTRKEFAQKHERSFFVGSFWKTQIIHKDEIEKKCAPYIYTKPRSEIGLPAQYTKIVRLEMPPEISECYRQFKETCIVHIGDIEVIMTTGIWIKYLQICAGFIIDTDQSAIMGESVIYRISDYKATVAKEMIDNSDSESIIVWGTFREELKMLSEIIPNSRLIMGGSGDGAKTVSDFKERKFRVLIANPQCIGVGVSLEVASMQIATSVNASCCLYEQTVARTNRINQKNIVTRYELIYPGTMEEKVNSLVKKKGNNQREIIEGALKNEFRKSSHK